jgi:hypothetical protein
MDGLLGSVDQPSSDDCLWGLDWRYRWHGHTFHGRHGFVRHWQDHLLRDDYSEHSCFQWNNSPIGYRVDNSGDLNPMPPRKPKQPAKRKAAQKSAPKKAQPRLSPRRPRLRGKNTIHRPIFCVMTARSMSERLSLVREYRPASIQLEGLTLMSSLNGK